MEPICQAHKEKRGLTTQVWTPFPKINTESTVIDVHRDFEAKTQIGVARCFPFHVAYLQERLLMNFRFCKAHCKVYVGIWCNAIVQQTPEQPR